MKLKRRQWLHNVQGVFYRVKWLQTSSYDPINKSEDRKKKTEINKKEGKQKIQFNILRAWDMNQW